MLILADNIFFPMNNNICCYYILRKCWSIRI